MTLPDLSRYYSHWNQQPARLAVIKATPLQRLLDNAHALYARITRRRLLSWGGLMEEPTAQAAADPIPLLPLATANQGTLRLVVPAVLSPDRDHADLRVAHQGGTLTVVITDRAGLTLAAAAQHTAPGALTEATVTLSNLATTLGSSELLIHIYLAATSPGTPHVVHQVDLREQGCDISDLEGSPRFPVLHREIAQAGMPLSAHLLHTLLRELHASNVHRLPSWSNTFDRARAPLLGGDRAGRGYHVWVDLSPECRTLKVSYTLEVEFASVSIGVYAVDQRGAWHLLPGGEHTPRAALESPQTWQVSVDLINLRQSGAIPVAIVLEPISYESGKTSNHLREVGPIQPGSLTSTTPMTPTWQPLSITRVRFLDGDLEPIEELPTTQGIRVQDNGALGTVYLWPHIDPERVADAGATHFRLEELGRARLLGVCVEEVHGTPSGPGRRYPIPDLEANIRAFAPGRPLLAPLYGMMFNAAEHLFLRRLQPHASGPSPSAAPYALDGDTSLVRSTRITQGGELRNYRDVPDGLGSRVLLWEGPAWIDDELAFEFDGDPARNIEGGLRWRGALELVPTLLLMGNSNIPRSTSWWSMSATASRLRRSSSASSTPRRRGLVGHRS
jgi:hypothetical protein